MRLNINDNVRVKLTPYGRQMHRANYDAMPTATRERYKYSPPDEDESGWSTWQLWDLMREFGTHVGFGMLPFETEIEIVGELPF